MQGLISITKHQPLLHTISISIQNCKVSLLQLLSWIQICFEKPSLRHLKLRLSPAFSEVILQILIIFLSIPCSHEQTLTLRDMYLKVKESPREIDGSISTKMHGTSGKLNNTLQYKSLVFFGRGFTPSFTNSVFSL